MVDPPTKLTSPELTPGGSPSNPVTLPSGCLTTLLLTGT